MKIHRIVAVFSLASCGFLSLASAGGKVPVHPVERRTGFYAVTTPGPTRQTTGIGKPPGLSGLSSWLTSNCEASYDSTDLFWLTQEDLDVEANFYTTSSAIVTATVNILNSSGATVVTSTFSDLDAAELHPLDEPTGFDVNIGQLPAGTYKAVIKIKQGSKTVGQQFWFQVYDDVCPQ